GTGGRVGRGGRRVGEPMRRNVEPTGEPEGQGNDQGVEVNEEKMELVQDMSGSGDDRKVKYIAGLFVGIDERGAMSKFHELDRLVPSLETSENKRIEKYVYGLALQIHGMVAAMEPTMIQSVVLKASVLTDEAIRNGSIKKKPEKRGNGGEPSRDRNVKDENKRTRI
ncbi:hypothetical protein Tco_0037946, partial [Tanacetum coccineum]